MNIFTIIVILFLLLFAVRGYRRGLIKTLVSMCFLLIASVLVYFATPYISDFLKEKTPVYSYIEAKCEQAFSLDELLTSEEDATKEEDASKLEQTQIIESLPLPESLQKQLLENNNKSGYENLGILNFSEYITSYMANLILQILTYLITWGIVMLLLKIIAKALDIIAHLPVLRGINRILGLLLGSLQGIILVWLAFLIITAFSSTGWGEMLMGMIYESPVLSLLYNYNIFLKYLMGIVSGLT